LKHARPDLDLQPLRGNVDTRIRKALEGELDAVVLAAAGLNRIGRPEVIAEHLDFLPAPAQGALGIQCRENDAGILGALSNLHHEATARCAVAERVLLNILEGGCSVPVGALGTIDAAGDVHLRGLVAAVDGSRVLKAEAVGGDPETVGSEVAGLLREQGAQEILDAAT
jgi:hydroxymethylbilane synthase